MEIKTICRAFATLAFCLACNLALCRTMLPDYSALKVENGTETCNLLDEDKEQLEDINHKYSSSYVDSIANQIISPQYERNLDAANFVLEGVRNGICLERTFGKSLEPELRELVRAYKNGQDNDVEVQDIFSKIENECHKLPDSKSYLHNIQDQYDKICNESPDARAMCYLTATLEYYGFLPEGTILNKKESSNQKYVCSDGQEHIIDAHGRIIDKGINAGTFNYYDPEEYPFLHGIYDVIAAIQKLPPKSRLTRDEFVEAVKYYIENQMQIAHDKTLNTLLPVESQRCEQQDLHSLDLDDPDGDWCKCGDQTGCKETTFMGAQLVIFQCPKCMKVNVKFARLALQREKEWSERGLETQWLGNRNDAVKAASEKQK